MIEYRFRPIDQWPGQHIKPRKKSKFKAHYGDTLKLLERELGYLQARNVVIQADCDERMIRQDGMLRSDARLNGPGVILAFDSKHGPLSYPCDTFTNWDCNLRAIALSLEGLCLKTPPRLQTPAVAYKLPFVSLRLNPSPPAILLRDSSACSSDDRFCAVGCGNGKTNQKGKDSAWLGSGHRHVRFICPPFARGGA